MNPGLFKRGRKRLLELFLRKALGLGSPERIAAFAARRYGKRIFLVQVEGDIELSFEDLVRKSRQTAEALGYRGLAAGEVLAFCARNSIEYFIYRLACHRLGLAFMALPESLDDAAASSCVAAVGARAYYSKGVLELLPAGRSPSLSDVSTLNVSSGTTGATPKIVGLSSRNWVESLYGYVGASEEKLDGTTVFLCTLPFATAGSTTFLPSLLGGITQIVVGENPEPALLADYIGRYEVNQLYLTPMRLFELAEWCSEKGRRLDSLRKIITGTELAPVPRLTEAIATFGPIIHVGYGMVEALPPLAMLSPPDYRKLGSVGRPLSGVEIEIRGDGRIAVRTKTVGISYVNDARESAAHFVNGWFVSNDYGYLDDEGFLYILGRKEEILSESPRRVFAAECEEALYRLDAVRRCAALAEDGRVVAFVSLRRGVDEAELAKAARAVIDCEIVVVDEIPVNGLGKIDRRTLARWALAHGALAHGALAGAIS